MCCFYLHDVAGFFPNERGAERGFLRHASGVGIRFLRSHDLKFLSLAVYLERNDRTELYRAVHVRPRCYDGHSFQFIFDFQNLPIRASEGGFR